MRCWSASDCLTEETGREVMACTSQSTTRLSRLFSDKSRNRRASACSSHVVSILKVKKGATAATYSSDKDGDVLPTSGLNLAVVGET